MPVPGGSYYPATRHPWPCFLFLLPLLLLYEGGVLWLGGTEPEALRNGADAWVRWALSSFGLNQMYLPPVFLMGIFIVWSWWRRRDRPFDLLGTTTGMAIESVLFAVGLWVISRELGPFLDLLGVRLSAGEPPPAIAQSSLEQAVGQVVTYVGAGVYEEVIFRLLLFSGLEWLLGWIAVPEPLTTLLGAVGSAAVFSAAHHFGPFGEPFNGYVFLFRTLAGLYFAVLFRLRGFGIAAGAHACYDVLIGGIVG
jgi:membrane protease YdiL (CAAX protease family)